MTVPSTARRAGPFAGNDATLTFPFSFKVFSKADVTTVLTSAAGAESTLTLDSDFSVTLNTDQDTDPGGFITYPLVGAPLPTGASLVLLGDIVIEQATALPAGGAYRARVVEDALDRLTMIALQIDAATDQAIRVPEASTVLPFLPNAATRANKLMGFDSLGNPTGVVPGPSGDATTLAADLLVSNNAAKGAGQLGFSAAMAYGVGTVGRWLKDLATSAGSALIGFLQAGTGAVVRTLQAKGRDVVSVKDFGAVGDAVADDTAAIQAAANYAMSIRGELYFPANDAGAYYKTTAPIVFTSALCIRGAGVQATTIFGVGLAGGQYLFDFDCVAANVVEEITISGLTLRSNSAAPNGLRLKNVAHVLVKAIRLYNLSNGVYIDGTRCYTHSFEQVNSTQITNYVAHWAPGFIGGGQFVFTGCAFYSNIGVFLPSTAFLDNLSFVGCNWEQNTGNCMVLNGTAAAVSIVGSRTEGCDGVDFVIAPTGAAEFVGGLHVAGNVLSASDAGAAARLRLGGGAGKVRGFSVTGNVITHGTDSFVGSLVELNGEGESGIISGNFVRGATGGVVNTQRAGVVVFGNENLAGKLAEWWGAAQAGFEQGNWTPVDGSGASLSFTAASGRWTRTGRTVFWQAFITYPATASGASAEVGGLPFAIGGLSGNAEGRAGGRCDLSNVGSAVGVMQGVTGNTEFAFYSPTALTAITNATLSGKQLYCSGTYTL